MTGAERDRLRALATAAREDGAPAMLEFKLACSPLRILELLDDLDAEELRTELQLKRIRELEPPAARGQHLRDYQRDWSRRRRDEALAEVDGRVAADLPDTDIPQSLDECREALAAALRAAR